MTEKRSKPRRRGKRRLLRDHASSFMPPPEAPFEGTRGVSPPEPTTAISELRVLPLTPFAYQTVCEAIAAASQVQHKKLNPKGGANLRYRIELARSVPG
jgi:hypothetical protein